MTPGARLAAAIQLLDHISGGTRGTDRVIRDFFRARRYAGSKDRRAVSGRVYEVLRRRGLLDWWLARCAAAATPRLEIIAYLAVVDGQSAAEIGALFSGTAHCPEVLSAAEETLIGALQAQDIAGLDPPVPVAGNFPAWLEDPLRERFGTRLESEIAALNQPAPVDLRINLLNASGATRSLEERRAEVLRRLGEHGIEAAPTALSPLGLRLAARARLEDSAPWRDGLIEIQDEGSQLVALLCAAEPGMTVIDYCAGAGGKTLALAAAMAGEGRLIACDIEARRLNRLEARAQRAGAGGIERRVLEDGDGLADLQAGAARVLVDAPCSGVGAWRRDPAARWRLTEDDLARLVGLQRNILRRAAALVAPGGRLIYATCSFLTAENEAQIDWFLREFTEFDLYPVGEILDAPWVRATASVDGRFLSVTPGTHGCDGFFAAVLERK